MRIQVLDVSYRCKETDDGPIVKIFGRTEQGESKLIWVRGFLPYCFCYGLPNEDIIHYAQAQGSHIQTEVVKRYEGIGFQPAPRDMVKITARDPKEIPQIKQKFLDNLPGCKFAETDILFRMRFMVDLGFGGQSWLEIPDKKSIHYSEIKVVEEHG
jgi:DNA polymerase I